MAEPVRCVCGGRAEVCEWDPDWFYVYCTRKRGALPCWFGRAHKTRPAAVRAWNKLMNAARKEKARG